MSVKLIINRCPSCAACNEPAGMTANGDPVCTYCGTQFVDPDKKTIGLVPGGFNPYAQAQQQNSYSQLSGNFQHPGFSSGGLASIAGAIGLLGILHGR